MDMDDNGAQFYRLIFKETRKVARKVEADLSGIFFTKNSMPCLAKWWRK